MYPTRERALSLSLLTRELGFLRARAEGVRTSESKMRSNLTSYAHVSVSLVRGRHEWRVVGVRSLSSFAPVFASHQKARCAVRIIQLYARLIPDEATGHGVLFDDLVAGFLLMQEHGISYEAIEILLVVRALSRLGYLPHDIVLEHLLRDDCSLDSLISKAHAVRPHAIPVINQALSGTQL